jgi:proton-translocating NADH-quinone oxidoreductase chain L
MYLLILVFPLLSFISAVFFGFFLGNRLVSRLTVFFVGLAFLQSLLVFYEVGILGSVCTYVFFDWISLGFYQIKFGLLFDTLTSIMLLVVTFISFLVHFYSVDYMGNDPHQARFMGYLSLFTFFMLILVTSDNFLQLFIGWEGVGLCSYLLISFWFTRILANKAALKAMFMNRIADVFFIFAILIFFFYFGTTDYIVVFELVPFLNFLIMHFFGIPFSFLDLICFFLFIGAIGKSAQLGLHTWLPDAMEGPTPVSSLLHAATMVTAGVFLIIRCSPIFEFSSNILYIISFIGGFTAFFFALVAVFQYDLKKIIAYSTCSQLGYMFVACGLSNYYLSLFHLFNHAFFKALLFLSAGSIIHALYDEQDIRRMGGLLNFLPFSYFCFLIGSLAIMAFPFFTGFYSKDLILEFALSRYMVDSLFIYFLILFAALFTSIYSFKLILFVFFGETNLYISYFPHDSTFFMYFSMFFLSILSIFIGYVFSDLFIGFGSDFFGSSIYISGHNFFIFDLFLISPLLRNLPLLISILGFIFGLFIYNFVSMRKGLINKKDGFIEVKTLYYNVFTLYRISAPFFFFSGFFNVIYNEIFIYLYNFSYLFCTKLIDKGFLELFGPFGLYKFFHSFSYSLKAMPSSIFFYIGFSFYSLTLILFIFLLFFNMTYVFALSLLFLFFVIIYFELSKNIVNSH